MRSSSPWENPELLAEQSERLRRLARRLLSNRSLAEDVSQDTWVTALRTPLQPIRDLQAWLGSVTRHLSFKADLSATRRERREQARARPPIDPLSPEAILEQEEARRQVVGALLRLREPYRRTLLLRYFEDLSPSEIARRLGSPAATVRTQIKRGLAELRQDLSSSATSNQRTSPPRGLMLLAGLPISPKSAPGGFPVGSSSNSLLPLFLRSLVMSAKITSSVGVGAAALVVVLGIAWWARSKETEADSPEEARIASGERADPRGVLPLPLAKKDPKAEALREHHSELQTSGNREWTLSIRRETGSLYGRVLDFDSKRPAPDANVTIHPAPGVLPAGFALREDRPPERRRTQTDDQGHFSFDSIPVGPYTIEVEDDLGRSSVDSGAALADPVSVQLWLGRPKNATASRGNIPVLVLDEAGNRVPNARVTLLGRASPSLGSSLLELEKRTDPEGIAEFDEHSISRGLLYAFGPDETVARRGFSRGDGLTRMMEAVADRGRARQLVILRLNAPGSIRGRILGTEGERVSVTAWIRSSRSRFATAQIAEHTTVCDERGDFLLDGISAGDVSLIVEAPRGRRLAWEPNEKLLGGQTYYSPRIVSVEPGTVAEITLELVSGPVLRGMVRRPSGEPIAGAKVIATRCQGLISDADRVRRGGAHLWRLDSVLQPEDRDPSVSRITSTDERGEYRITGLPPGNDYRLEVFATGLSYDRRDRLELVDGEELTLEHTLRPAGGLQGIARSWSSFGLRLRGEPEVMLSWLAPRTPVAPFTIPGLPAGFYEILDLHSDEKKAPIFLTEVEIREGELTFVDLVRTAPCQAQGTIRYRGAPVAGATLSFFGPQETTDLQGNFVYPFARPWNGTRQFDLFTPSLPDSVSLRLGFDGMCAGDWSRTIDLPEGEIEVSLLDESGAPIPGGAVTLRPLPTEAKQAMRRGFTVEAPPGGMAEARTLTRSVDDRGRVRFAVLPPDLYQLSARVDSGVHVNHLDFELEENEHEELTLRVTPGVPLEIFVRDEFGEPVLGQNVHLNYFAESSEEETDPNTPESIRFSFDLGKTDVDGRIRCPNAPFGRARAVLLTPWFRRGLVGSVTIELRAGYPLEATITGEKDWRWGKQ